jgi:hypothetical protein
VCRLTIDGGQPRAICPSFQIDSRTAVGWAQSGHATCNNFMSTKRLLKWQTHRFPSVQRQCKSHIYYIWLTVAINDVIPVTFYCVYRYTVTSAVSNINGFQYCRVRRRLSTRCKIKLNPLKIPDAECQEKLPLLCAYLTRLNTWALWPGKRTSRFSAAPGLQVPPSRRSPFAMEELRRRGCAVSLRHGG